MPRIRQKENVYRNEDFRRAVKANLALLGLQQKDLANRLALSEATVSGMMKHPENIPVDRMRIIIGYLQLEPAVVLRLYGYKEKEIQKEMEP